MTAPEGPERRGLIAELARAEARLLPRILGVLRFDSRSYDEIAEDTSAIPQSFAVVIATALAVGVGRGSVAGLFLGIAWSLALWLLGATLIWGVATLANDEDVPFPRLMRCLGFADAWFALLLLSGLPWIGGAIGWIAVASAAASFVLATRAATRTSTGRAAAVCGIALGAPLILLWCVSACAG